MAAAPLSARVASSRGPTRLVAASDFYVLGVMMLLSAVAAVGSARLRDLVATTVSAAAFRMSRRKRRGCEATLARAFGPRLRARRRRAIVRGAFDVFWRDTFSQLPLRGGPEGPLAPIVGVEHLRTALAGGRGAILWVSNNWAGMTTLKRSLHAHGFAVHKVHSEHHVGGFPGFGETWVQQRVITPFFDRYERTIVAGIVTIRPGSLAFGRDLAARLRANEIVCIAADGRIGRRFIPHRFVGIDEAFPTGAVTLARTSGAPLLPIFCLRGPGRAARVVIEPPIPPPAEGDREQGTRAAISRYVERLERRARRHPSSYVNWHLVGTRLPPATD